MNPTPNDLTRDPLFQLNLLLWLTQPLPTESSIEPLLYRRGFGVYAIAPPLALPLDLQLAAQEAEIRIQAAARPDVVLANQSSRKYGLVECKARSFGAASPTSEQARAFMLMAGPRIAEVLALAPADVNDSILAYLTPEDQRDAFNETLSELKTELDSAKLPTGVFSVLGIEIHATELRLVVDERGGAFFALTPGAHRAMNVESETDPRPLYFIPYDPDVQLSGEERQFCKRVLFERIHSGVLACVGRSHVPSEVLLESRGLLNDAMFGMYENWENPDSEKHMRRLCRELMHAISRAVNSEAEGAVVYEPERGWKIELNSEEQRQKVINALSRFSCETMVLRAEPTQNLFDVIDDDGEK